MIAVRMATFDVSLTPARQTTLATLKRRRETRTLDNDRLWVAVTLLEWIKTRSSGVVTVDECLDRLAVVRKNDGYDDGQFDKNRWRNLVSNVLDDLESDPELVFQH